MAVDARTAIASALAAVDELRRVAETELPAPSPGRARIVAACDAALSSASIAISGDDPSVVRRALERALEQSRRAVQEARRVARQVQTATEEQLRRAWRVATAPARNVRREISRRIDAAAATAERAIQTAGDIVYREYRYAVDTGTQKVGIAVFLVGMAFLYVFRPGKK